MDERVTNEGEYTDIGFREGGTRHKLSQASKFPTSLFLYWRYTRGHQVAGGDAYS